MKNWKLVSGILSIVFFAVILFQSCAAGVYNTLEANGEISGSAGVMVAILMLAGGIVSIATRQSTKKGGNIALLVLFLLAALVGFGNAGSYSDLYIWSVWCLICAVLSVVAMVQNKRRQDGSDDADDSQGKDLK
jgi:Ca2+/Na+ antiporter